MSPNCWKFEDVCPPSGFFQVLLLVFRGLPNLKTWNSYLSGSFISGTKFPHDSLTHWLVPYLDFSTGYGTNSYPVESWKNCQTQQKLMAQMLLIPSAHPLMTFLCHLSKIQPQQIDTTLLTYCFCFTFLSPTTFFRLVLLSCWRKVQLRQKSLCHPHLFF